MQFEYFKEVKLNATIDIEDIGNCAIYACNDNYEEYYLVVESIYGKTYVLEYGPEVVDTDQTGNYIGSSLTKYDCNDKKTKQNIDKWLNDSHKCITQAKEIPIEEAVKQIKNLTEFLI